MKDSLQLSIEQERDALTNYINGFLVAAADVSATVWDSIERLDELLIATFPHIGGCKLLYAVDCDGFQYSANISSQGMDESKRKQDLSVRPYMNSVDTDLKQKDFTLSSVYIDLTDHHPCVTGMHVVKNTEGEILGCIAADYDLSVLPAAKVDKSIVAPLHWQQIKGDPAIRQNLFQQERVMSALDEHMDEVNGIITDLLLNRGVFHVKLHFSSSRATLWLYNDPHRYRLHVLDEIIDPSVCLAYPALPYPEDSLVEPRLVENVLERFRLLRDADSTIYLRSASLNIINGMVGLTFSCDGSHYMSVDDFLGKDEEFWFGIS